MARSGIILRNDSLFPNFIIEMMARKLVKVAIPKGFDLLETT